MCYIGVIQVNTSPSYISKNRCGIFYFQYRVPPRLLIGADRPKTLIRASLHTKERREAIKKARHWFVFIESLDFQSQDNPQHFFDTVDDVIKQKRRLRKEDQNAVEVFLHSHLQGTPVSQPPSQLIAHTATVVTPRTNQKKRNDETKSPMLSKVIEDYVEDISSLWDERHKKVNGIDLVPKLGLFLEVVGNKPIDTVTLEDVSRFKSLVSRYPSNKNKRPQYRNLSAVELSLLDVPKEDRLSITSIGKYFQRITSFLKWAKSTSSYIEHELWHPLDKRPKNSSSEDEQRDILDEKDLRKLFESIQYQRGTHRHPSHHWVPLLAIFTGARANELCQLHRDDIYKDEETGIWVIDINQSTIDKNSRDPITKGLYPFTPF